MFYQKPGIPIKKLTLISIDRIGFKELATEFKPIRNWKI